MGNRRPNHRALGWGGGRGGDVKLCPAALNSRNELIRNILCPVWQAAPYSPVVQHDMLVVRVKLEELGLTLSLAPHSSLECVAERVSGAVGYLLAVIDHV